VKRSRVGGVVAAVVALGAATGVMVPLRDGLALPVVVLLFLVPVLAGAAFGGLWPALGAAVVAELLVNWFFVPPYRTLAVQGGENLVTLVVYLLVAVAAGLAVDATAARAAEAARLAETDRLRSALLGAVGHDLRTPLAGIKAAVSSLRQPDVTFSEEDRGELLATVEESADRLTAVINNLLALSRLQAGALAVDVHPVAVDWVVAEVVLHHDGDVLVDVPDDLPDALADTGLLERVLVNLLANARAAGGPVTVRGRATAGRVTLAVEDHGPGIAPEKLAAAFAPFQRLNDHTGGGLGLGLAIARGFTEAQGGTLAATRTEGGGLTMTITLRAAAPS
jgi:two-component system, OmpR family, sensor histidine kinase KdpD